MADKQKKKVNWEEMFPDELLVAIEACPACYMAYGLTGPHGAYIKQSLSSSLPNDFFQQMVLHRLRDFDARNFLAAVLITGHYGELEDDMRLLCEYYTRRTGSPIGSATVCRKMFVLIPSHW